MLGGIGGRRRRVQHRMRWLDGITDLMDVSLSVCALLAGGRDSRWGAIQVSPGEHLTSNLSEQDDVLMSPLGSPDATLSMASSGYYI